MAVRMNTTTSPASAEATRGSLPGNLVPLARHPVEWEGPVCKATPDNFAYVTNSRTVTCPSCCLCWRRVVNGGHYLVNANLFLDSIIGTILGDRYGVVC